MTPKTMIPTTPQGEQHLDSEQQARATAIALIRKQIVHALGKPTDLLTVQVRPLWENWYRANVFVGRDETSACIANSYFLKVDGDGNIVESNPKIERRRQE